VPNFNSIGSGVSEPQVAEHRYLPLTGGIALTTVYALTCYTVMARCIAHAPNGRISTSGLKSDVTVVFQFSLPSLRGQSMSTSFLSAKAGMFIPLRMNAGCTGKTVRSLENACHT